MRGHPVGFDRRFREGLLAVSGDQGARHVLATYRHDMTLIDCADPGILRDIDTPEDLGARRPQESAVAERR